MCVCVCVNIYINMYVVFVCARVCCCYCCYHYYDHCRCYFLCVWIIYLQSDDATHFLFEGCNLPAQKLRPWPRFSGSLCTHCSSRLHSRIRSKKKKSGQLNLNESRVKSDRNYCIIFRSSIKIRYHTSMLTLAQCTTMKMKMSGVDESSGEEEVSLISSCVARSMWVHV